MRIGGALEWYACNDAGAPATARGANRSCAAAEIAPAATAESGRSGGLSLQQKESPGRTSGDGRGSALTLKSDTGQCGQSPVRKSL
jgi:hypothetical protein